ncbi:hypothetical protein BDN72DRAFT_882326 [Pluteus cervinus]|uniref:Uncharacterized protein n=1 Tax=Pluteus cervinus TaxID=181527 RepID=A0ACD3ADV3_9AGAR|nr:hypothetical protein BDN72DRAFT_882326 [Pluteus cervinus]
MSAYLTPSTPSVSATPLLRLRHATSPATTDFHRLPNELKTMVLSYAASSLPNCSAPIFLGLVSREWRALTLSIPALWAEVSLNFDSSPNVFNEDAAAKVDSAFQWLSRAGKQRTTVKIVHLVPKPMYATIGFYSRLYRRLIKKNVTSNLHQLILDVHPHILGCILQPLHKCGGCGRLDHLKICNSWNHNNTPGRRHVPEILDVAGGKGVYQLLTKLTIFDTSPGAPFIRYFSTARPFVTNLTCLDLGHRQVDLGYFAFIHPILERSPQLITLGLTLPGWATDSDSATPSVPLTLQHLTELRVHVVCPRSASAPNASLPTDLRPLFRSLTLPSLRSLIVANGTRDWSPCLLQVLIDLRCRSQFPLIKFSVEGLELDDVLLVALLRSRSTLEQLELVGCEIDSEYLLEHMKYNPSLGDSTTGPPQAPFLPRLRAFKLIDTYGENYDMKASELLDVVMSRWNIQDSDPIVKWQDVTVLIPPLNHLKTWDQRSKEILERFEEQKGIDVELFEEGTDGMDDVGE